MDNVVKLSHESCARTLLEESVDGGLETRLFLAAAHEQVSLEMLKLLLERSEVMKLLLRHGANPEVRKQHHSTSLHAVTAGWQDDSDVIRTMLMYGANPNTSDKDGNTALHLAAAHGHGEVVRSLLKWSADPQALNKNSLTPSLFAMQHGMSGIATLLRKHEVPYDESMLSLTEK
ncbi:hypothetical protein MBLNU13_g10466t1 [Cladosporium sp. NU13]